MSRFRATTLGLALSGMLLAGSTPLCAQDGVGFRFLFGAATMSGDIGQALDRAVDAEFSILVPVWRVRLGGGANWASFKVDDEEASWSQVRLHLLAGYPFRLSRTIRPYVEARYTFQRLRPEDDRYFGAEEDEVLRDFVASGSGFEGVLGAEIVVSPRWAIDVSGAYGGFSVSPDLSEEGFGPIDSGTTWRVHAGVSWFPVNDQ